jgi:hypothetical protein
LTHTRRDGSTSPAPLGAGSSSSLQHLPRRASEREGLARGGGPESSAGPVRLEPIELDDFTISPRAIAVGETAARLARYLWRDVVDRGLPDWLTITYIAIVFAGIAVQLAIWILGVMPGPDGWRLR